MKRFSTTLLFISLAALLYINVGGLARICMGLVQTKLEAIEKTASPTNTIQLAIAIKEVTSGEASFPERNEIRYHGKMYDISSGRREGDTLYLQVVRDEKEEGLLSELKEEVEHWFNFSQRSTDKKPVVKQHDLIKDFFPAGKLAFNVIIPSVDLSFITNADPSATPLLPVAETPPKRV